MENYIKSTELWLEVMALQLEQKQDNLDHNKRQIELCQKENQLLTKQINHDFNWMKQVEKELEEYKNDNHK